MTSTLEEANVSGRCLVSVSRPPDNRAPVDEFTSTIPKEAIGMFWHREEIGQDYTESILERPVVILDPGATQQALERRELKPFGKAQPSSLQVDLDSSSIGAWGCLLDIKLFLTVFPAKFNQARLAIKSYSALTDDWDGAKGLPPSQRAIDESMDFLSQLEQLGVIEPKTMLSNDGEIGFYWRTDLCYLEIGMMGNGNWGAYGIHYNKTPELMIDDHPIDNIPKIFVEFLQEARLL